MGRHLKGRVLLLSVIHPLQMVMGLIVWSLWFVAIYSGLSVACSLAPPAVSPGAMTWINGILLALTFFTTMLLLWCAYRCWRAPAAPGNRRFVARIAAGVYLFAAAATLAVGLPISLLPPCV